MTMKYKGGIFLFLKCLIAQGRGKKVGKTVGVTKLTTGEMCRQKLLTHTFPDGTV